MRTHNGFVRLAVIAKLEGSGEGGMMSEKDVLYRIIENEKSERNNLLVSLDRVTAEINALTNIYNKPLKNE